MYDIKEKDKNIELLTRQMLNKTLSMFEYSNLPDSIPPKTLERILQTNGHCFLMEVDGEVYPLTGTLGGELDPYDEFTQITISNTALKISKQFDVKKDGVLISNDDLKIGLLPFFDKMNYMLVENDINMILWGYNSRQQKQISATDDKTKSSAESYITKIKNGDLSVIADTPFLEGLKVHNNGSSSQTNVKEFLELHQYLKSNLLNEVGISSNFNMKKERLISSELDVGEDSLFPLVYTMMKNRIEGVNKINEFFGLEIDVNFGSVWALKNKKLVDGVTNDDENLEPLAMANNIDGTVEENNSETEINQERERGEDLAPDLEPETDLEGESNVDTETNDVEATTEADGSEDEPESSDESSDETESSDESSEVIPEDEEKEGN